MNQRERFMMWYARAFILLLMPALLAVTAAGQGRAAAASPEEAEREVAAFFESIERGDAAAVRRFLARGLSASAVAPLSGGEVALMRAVRLGRAEVVEALLDGGADVNVKEDGDESSALSVAAACGYPRVVRVLLARGADVNYGDKAGHSNLMTAALAAGEYALPAEARLFLNPDAESLEGISPGSVPRGDRLEIVRLLVEAGAELNTTAADCGLNALMGASMLGDAEVARMLLDAGADPNLGTQQFNPLGFATMTREEFMQQSAGEGGEADEDGRRRAAAFFDATEKGRAEVARMLRAAGAKQK
jgi:ankyrin repeat protein